MQGISSEQVEQGTDLEQQAQETKEHKDSEPAKPAAPTVPATPAEGFELIDQILELNRLAAELEPQRQLARKQQQGWDLQNNLLTRFGKLMVPEPQELRTHLILEVHSRLPSAHPGQAKTLHLLADQYYWPTLRKDCKQFVQNCRVCRRTHIPRDKTPGLLKPLTVGDQPWQHIQMDLHYMPKDQQGYDCVLVVVDRFTKRSFTLPCKRSIDAPGIAELYYTNIWRIYGVPESVLTDRGSQFVSAFTNELCKLTGVKQHLSSAYHSPTNGGVEIVNQYIDQRLRAFVNHNQDDWARLLPAMDFAQATLKHESTGYSPYELELGHKPRLHFNWEDRSCQASTPTELKTREQAQAFAERAHNAWKSARENLLAA